MTDYAHNVAYPSTYQGFCRPIFYQLTYDVTGANRRRLAIIGFLESSFDSALPLSKALVTR